MHITHPRSRGVRSVEIHVIAAQDQRYPTTGDWVYDSSQERLDIYVSKTGDWREEQCVAFHELREALLCIQNGVNPDAVDDFDKHFEANRTEDDFNEPGDDLRAPYYNEHQKATAAEHALAHDLGLHWPTYDANCGAASDAWANSGHEYTV